MAHSRPTAQGHVFFLLELGQNERVEFRLASGAGLRRREPLAGAGSQEGTVMLNLDRI